MEQCRGNEEVLKAYLTAILKRMMEDNVQVQVAVCATLAEALNQDGQCIEPYINDIVQVFKYVSDKYKKTSLEKLYDAIAALSYNVAHAKIQNPAIESVLMEIMVKKWNESQFNDRESVFLVGII